MRHLFISLTLLFSLALISCDDSTSENNANNINNINNSNNANNTNNTNNTNNINNTNNTNNTSDLLVTEVLEEGIRDVDGISVNYQTLRLTWGSRDTTYAFFAWPADATTPRPAVMATMPYDVIDWTGEAVDTEAALDATPLSVDNLLDQSFVHMFHGFTYMAAFGRFYTGGSIENDVQDMSTALKFLGQSPRVDASRIAIYGGSWGGFEALYGAAYAPDEAVPAVGVALFPVSDFASMVEHVVTIPDRVTNQEKADEYDFFYAPYLERIYLTTGGAPGEAGSDYTGYTLDTMLPRLATPFMVWHEMHDTLVPFDNSVALAAQSPLVDPLWYYYSDPLDLNTEPLGHGHFSNTIYSLLFAYMYTVIADPAQQITIIHFPAEFTAFMEYLRSIESMGYESAFILPILQTLADDRVIMFSGAGEPTPTGSALLTEQFNTVFCLAPPITEADLPELLSRDALPTSQCP